MEIGLISDTHDNIKNIEAAVKIFSERKLDYVIHAGDITTPVTVGSFLGVRLIGVLGNNDLDVQGLDNAFRKIGGELRGDFCEIEQDSLIIGVYHGTDSKRRESIIQSGKYDLVICGHTHRIEDKEVAVALAGDTKTTIVINPGTAHGWFFGYNATAAIFDTITRKREFIQL